MPNEAISSLSYIKSFGNKNIDEDIHGFIFIYNEISNISFIKRKRNNNLNFINIFL